MKLRLLSLSIVLALLLTFAPAWAHEAPGGPPAAIMQGGGDGEGPPEDMVFEGIITDEAFTESWGLQMPTADRIAIRVERSGGNLIPEVELQDGNGQRVARSGPDETAAAAEITDMRLPTGGTYTIVVGREGAENGATTGTYTLRVSLRAAAPDSPANMTPIGSVSYDIPIEGEITPDHWDHLYTLDAPARDAIRIIAERTSGTLFPEVELLDGNGQSLRRGSVNNAGDMAQAEHTLPGPGQYTVAVRRAQGFDGDTVGGYRLTVELTGSGEDSPLLAGPAGTVAYDTPLQGTISNARWYEDWTLTTDAGDTITITAQRVMTDPAGGNLQPEVYLLGGSGQELRRARPDSTGAQAIIEHYTLNGPGTFTVRVQRARGQAGVTTGAYLLVVSLDGSGEGSPLLAEPAGIVENKMPIEGTITNGRWIETWLYEGTADEHIAITVTRSEGTLIPRIDLQDANGQSLRSVRAESSRDMAIINDYRLPGPGQYRIVVFRERGQEGRTTGTYTLLVEPAAE